MTIEKKKLHLMPTTHWDRAWYWSFQRFRVRLIELFGSMLECFRNDPEYQFVLDGQAVALEDYLEVCPEDREELMGYAKEGRFHIGPLYVLPDSYGTGGESLIRNYLVGTEIVEQFGGDKSKMFYTPDSFGFIPSTPMLVEGLGLESFSFMRGNDGNVDSSLRLFVWECPDGSKTRVLRLQHGYGNAANLGEKSLGIASKIDIDKGIDDLIDRCDTQVDAYPEPYTLLAGMDHVIPTLELLDIKNKTNLIQDKYDIIYSNWNNVVEEIMMYDDSSWTHYCGEMHSQGAAGILGGTISTRIFLKQKNAEIERMLCGVAEPLDAITTLMGKGDSGGKALRSAWKNLLKVHPHDDITGCGIDKVHDDDEYLLDEAEDAADAVRRRMIHNLQELVGGYEEGDDRYGFYVINMQAFTRSTRFKLICDFEGRIQWGDEKPPQNYVVVDEQGNEIPAIEIERGRSEEHPHQYLIIEGEATIAAMSIHRLYLQPTSIEDKKSKTCLGNDLVKVDVKNNGTFDLLNKTTGQLFTDLSLFTDQGDNGDSYDFSDIIADSEKLYTDCEFTITPLPVKSGFQSVKLEGVLSVPITSDDDGRSAELVDLPMSITVSLTQNSEDVIVDYNFTNTASDHRLRINMPLPFKVEKVRAGIKFNEVTTQVRSQPRKAVKTEDKGEFKAEEMDKQGSDFRIHPEFTCDHFVSFENEKGGLALYPEFPVNYELVDGKNQRLAVTILRSVAYLSRGGMNTRTKNAGPTTKLSGAQMLNRDFSMRFIYRAYSAEQKGDLFRDSVLNRQNPATGLIEGFGKNKVENANLAKIEIDNCNILISALKIKQKRDGVLIRFFNPTATAQSANLKMDCANKLTPCGLNEDVLSNKNILYSDAGLFKLRVPPYGLTSYLIS
jgi:mannosylglycerate hydrolase